MRIAYLDCFSGISGDMFLGALVDAGVSPDLLRETVAALNVGARLEISRVDRSGISATKVDVYVGDEKELPKEEYWAKVKHGEHHHDHGHEHDHDHDTPPHHHHEHEHHVHGRGLKEIREILQQASISDRARKTALAIFQALGEAESKIHNTDIARVLFHEVGAVDAMVDITCAAVGAEALAVDEFICSPINVGAGT